MFLSYQATEEHCSSDLWMLDSSYSNHMIGNKSLFSSLDSSVVTNIKQGDEFMVPAKGKGTIPILIKKMKRNSFMRCFMYLI